MIARLVAGVDQYLLFVRNATAIATVPDQKETNFGLTFRQSPSCHLITKLRGLPVLVSIYVRRCVVARKIQLQMQEFTNINPQI